MADPRRQSWMQFLRGHRVTQLLRVPLRLFARAFSIAQSLVRLVFDRLPLLSVGGSPPPPPPLPTGPQTLLLVRHGQSMHNIASVAKYGDTGADASLFDAPLSPLGETQVAALAGHELLAKAELIISSPLTRAVQTLFGAFPPLSGAPPAPVELWPLVSEHLTDSCDIGTGAAELAKRFPTLHASTLPEVWWYTGGVQETAAGSRERYRECGFMEPEKMFIGRVDAFVEKLRQRPESVIAVFGHSDFFNDLMERHGGVIDYWLENAELYSMELPREPPAAEPAAPPPFAP